MKNRIITIISAIFITSTLGACQQASQRSGGSVVGNGILRFHHETYDFGFEYNAELTLTQKSNSLTTLNNAKLLRDTKIPVSNVEFEVIETEQDDVDGVLALARSKAPQALWQQTQISGVKGVYSRSSSETELTSEYFYIIGEKTVLNIRVEAVAAGQGIALINPTLESLTFDTKSPTIHEAFFDPPVIKAGQTTKLKIRASDNMTAISGTNTLGNVGVGLEEKCRYLTTSDWHQIDVCAGFREIGNGWFEFDIPTNPRTPEGQYTLHPLTIWDEAGNPTSLTPNFKKGVFQVSISNTDNEIPLAYLTLTNENPDNMAPKISNIRFEPSQIHAGEKGKLIFSAHDDDPAFVVNDIWPTARHKFFYRYPREDLPKDSEYEPTEYSLKFGSSAKQRPDGDWEVEFSSEKSIPAGIYEFFFNARDAVGNISDTIFLDINVSNKNPIDREGPRVQAVVASKNSYIPGETVTIKVQVTDNLSGVDEKPNFNWFQACRVGVKNRNPTEEDKNFKMRVQMCDSQFRHLEGDWYAIDFKLGANIPTGEYWLPAFQVQDRVGNRTYVQTSDGSDIYNYRFSEETTRVPVVTFRVDR
jgi:hypothetical protein